MGNVARQGVKRVMDGERVMSDVMALALSPSVGRNHYSARKASNGSTEPSSIKPITRATRVKRVKSGERGRGRSEREKEIREMIRYTVQRGKREKPIEPEETKADRNGRRRKPIGPPKPHMYIGKLSLPYLLNLLYIHCTNQLNKSPNLSRDLVPGPLPITEPEFHIRGLSNPPTDHRT